MTSLVLLTPTSSPTAAYLLSRLLHSSTAAAAHTKSSVMQNPAAFMPIFVGEVYMSRLNSPSRETTSSSLFSKGNASLSRL
mmetsp:Transcript_8453/g.21347  ORF Transcript_8453/g.21347 Transcript_8453/m.21347 type:complete len:81 (+) Transcript_8453:157-399(+)